MIPLVATGLRHGPRLVAAIALAWLLALPAPIARAQQIERIAAVVNDEVISLSDVQGRVQLALVAGGLQPTPENQRQVLQQVLRSLIDEALQRQEAAQIGVAITPSDVAQAMESVAAQNGQTVPEFGRMLQTSGVAPATLESQIEAQLLWRGVIQRRILPTVDIGDEDVDEELAAQQRLRGRPEYLVSEILLPVPSPDREAETREFAQQLVGQIRSGAPFGSLARQFGSGPGAETGGNLGWVPQGQLAPALDQVLPTLPPGSVGDPVRTVSGYHILTVRDRRTVGNPDPGEAIVRLGRLAMAYPQAPTQALVDRMVALLRQETAGIRGCPELARVAERLDAPGIDAGSGRVASLPGALRSVLDPLEVGEPSAPQSAPEGVIVFMICDRQSPDAVALDREAIANALLDERVDLLQRRYLRDLRNAAFIDVRL